MTTTPEHQNTDREEAPKQPSEAGAEATLPPVAADAIAQAPATPRVPEFLAPEATQPPSTQHMSPPVAPSVPVPPAAPAAPVAPSYTAPPAAPEHPAAPVAPAYAPPAAAPSVQAAGQFPAPHTPVAHTPAPHTPTPQHAPGSAGPETAGHAAPADHNQPTVQLNDVYQAPGFAPGVAHGTQHTAQQVPGLPQDPAQPGAAFGAATTTEVPRSKNRTGALLAGLAIGALLGGVVGGGVAAVVASNVSPQSVAQGNSAITLNNAENATAISGVAAVATPSVVTLEVASSTASGSGSGVIYSEDGYIVTNAHVVTLDGAALEGATVRVKLSDGRILDGSVVGVDPYADLAVVKVDATGLPAITVADSDKLDVGDLTVAIGAPLNLANTVTSGVVSALNRGISVGSPLIPQDPSQQPEDQGEQGEQGTEPSNPWDFRFGLPDGSEQQQEQQQQATGGSVTLPVIQTDASINPGNSGGALLNGSGELIGINVAIASASASSGTAGSNGLGFAIPSNLAARVADAIIAGEQPSHGLLGASVADSSQDTDEDANHAGGLLVDVVKDGAAAKAGLKAGDVITAVNDVAAVDGTSVSALIRMHEGGSKITIDYTRNGKPGQVEATLGNLEW